MADGKPGRPPDSDELKAAKQRLRSAPSDEAVIAAQADIDAIRAREKAARPVAATRKPAPALGEEELFKLLVESEPHVRKAEETMKRLSTAFGSMSAARKRLQLFRRAMTVEGEAEARELIEMRQRLAARKDEGTSAAPAAPDMHAAA